MKQLLSCLLIASFFGSLAAEKLPSRDHTLKILIKVNNLYMKNHPDPLKGIPYPSRNKTYEANIWTRAVYFEGLMALHSIYPENRYIDYATK